MSIKLIKIVKRSKIVGRGISSGKGKTCGKGTKGQNSRAGGGTRYLFEGGQTELFRRWKKYGLLKRSSIKIKKTKKTKKK